MTVARLAIVLSVVATAACARAMFVPPVGPGAPVADGAAAWAEASARCRNARTYAAALRLSGRAGDQRIVTMNVDLAVADDQSIYLGATVAGRPVFVLAGAGGEATLWLRREHRTVTAAPGAILDAIAGMPIAPARLLAVLSGCVAREFDPRTVSAHERLVRVETADATVYLERQSGVWRTLAGLADGFIIEFARAGASLPQKVWLWSEPGQPVQARLELTVVESELNGQVPPQVFTPPAGSGTAAPMTIEELRAMGPWKTRAPAHD